MAAGLDRGPRLGGGHEQRAVGRSSRPARATAAGSVVSRTVRSGAPGGAGRRAGHDLGEQAGAAHARHEHVVDRGGERRGAGGDVVEAGGHVGHDGQPAEPVGDLGRDRHATACGRPPRPGAPRPGRRARRGRPPSGCPSDPRRSGVSSRITSPLATSDRHGPHRRGHRTRRPEPLARRGAGTAAACTAAATSASTSSVWARPGEQHLVGARARGRRRGRAGRGRAGRRRPRRWPGAVVVGRRPPARSTGRRAPTPATRTAGTPAASRPDRRCPASVAAWRGQRVVGGVVEQVERRPARRRWRAGSPTACPPGTRARAGRACP